MSVAALQEQMNDGSELVVIDVRSPGEVEQGVIPGALTISLPELLGALADLDPHRPTVVYCASGYRSAIAASLLRAHGFDDVSDVTGGWSAWAASPRVR